MSAHKDPTSNISIFLAYLLSRQGQWIDVAKAAEELNIPAGALSTVSYIVANNDDYMTFTRGKGKAVTQIKLYDRTSSEFKRSGINAASWPVPASLKPKLTISREAPVKTVYMRHEEGK